MDTKKVWKGSGKRLNKITELRGLLAALAALAANGLDFDNPRDNRHYQEQINGIQAHVRDMVAEAESIAWDDGYGQCTFDIAKGQNI